MADEPLTPTADEQAALGGAAEPVVRSDAQAFAKQARLIANGIADLEARLPAARRAAEEMAVYFERGAAS